MTREEAIQALNEIFDDSEFSRYESWYGTAMDMAIEALSADTISRKDTVTLHSPITIQAEMAAVVRCKDCDREYGSPVCPIQSEGWAINQDTFYCAWGERREP